MGKRGKNQEAEISSRSSEFSSKFSPFELNEVDIGRAIVP